MDSQFIIQLIWSGISIGCVLIGYALGRNSAERPILNPDVRIHKRKKDPTGEPDGDIFNDAMRGDDDTRYSTIGE